MALAKRPKVMGILNVTPDSFWDGGKYQRADQALARALSLQSEGADILDVGAESTRPGSNPISLEEEQKRLFPVLQKILPTLSIPVSIDTTKAEIAAKALAMGAHIVNDTSAMSDKAMGAVVANAKAGIILMHRKGNPRIMQRKPAYRHCVLEIKNHLRNRIRLAQAAGIPKKRIWIDPGIGFGKTLQHNLQILQNLPAFRSLGCSVVLGVSRKSFLGALLGTPAEERLAGSLAAALFAALQEVDVLRVHDVRETVQALKVLEALGAFQFNDRKQEKK